MLKKCKLTLRHIVSHQDKHKDILTFEEKLNQFCDKKCESFYKECYPDMIPNPNTIKLPDVPHGLVQS